MMISKKAPNKMRQLIHLILLVPLLIYSQGVSSTPSTQNGNHTARLRSFNQASAPAPLVMRVSEQRILAGTTFRLTFTVGSETTPVLNLFGLGFELSYTSDNIIRPINLDQLQSGPFLEPNTYNFAKHEPERSLISLAVSRKLGDVGKSGSGDVLAVEFQVSEQAQPGAQFCFSIQNVVANDSVGNPVEVQAGPQLCLTVAELKIEVLPNPFTPNEDGKNDQVQFIRDGGIPPEWTIVIMDRSARVVRRLTGGDFIWDGRDESQRDLLPGVYLYAIEDGATIVKRGLIGLVR